MTKPLSLGEKTRRKYEREFRQCRAGDLANGIYNCFDQKNIIFMPHRWLGEIIIENLIELGHVTPKNKEAVPKIGEEYYVSINDSAKWFLFSELKQLGKWGERVATKISTRVLTRDQP